MNFNALRSLQILPVGKERYLTLCRHRYLSSEARTFDAKQLKADQDYCVDLVMKRDREGYRKSLWRSSCHSLLYIAILF